MFNKQLKFVIAGTRAEFDYWFHDFIERNGLELGWDTYQLIYVTGVDMLRGRRDISGYLVGSWYNRNNIAEIIEQIRVSNTDPPNLFYNYVEKFPYRLDEKGRIIEYKDST